MQKWEELAYAREDGWKDGRQAGIQEGIEKGMEKGILATYIELLKDGLISPVEVAKRLQLSVQEVEQMTK